MVRLDDEPEAPIAVRVGGSVGHVLWRERMIALPMTASMPTPMLIRTV